MKITISYEVEIKDKDWEELVAAYKVQDMHTVQRYAESAEINFDALIKALVEKIFMVALCSSCQKPIFDGDFLLSIPGKDARGYLCKECADKKGVLHLKRPLTREDFNDAPSS